MSKNNIKKYHILVIDDDSNITESLRDVLEFSGYSCDTALTGAEGLKKLRGKSPYDLLITDVRLPDISGIEILEKAGKKYPFMPVVVITGFSSIENTKEALKKGAVDYIPKPYKTETVLSSIKRIFAYSNSISPGRLSPIIVYKSQIMEDVMELVSRVSKTDSTVLITGESGTGKELIARAIHRTGKRSQEQFVTVNSGALPENLLESELFGHVRGAYTGAISTTLGRFQVADGGTLFLDEISNMSPAMQVKLLRVLQTGEFSPVGSSENYMTDTRLLAASNIDLEVAVRDHNFREDLYYRLNVIDIHLPPLRERRDDIIPLAEYFLNRFSGSNDADSYTLSPDTVSAMLAYSWPGNIRELENVLERAVLLNDENILDLSNLPKNVVDNLRSMKDMSIADNSFNLDSLLENTEVHYIVKALIEAGGNKSMASELLGLRRTTLLARMKK
nr:sigma-54-dependent Fis family transcriptional regulator [FCB group bacterium]